MKKILVLAAAAVIGASANSMAEPQQGAQMGGPGMGQHNAFMQNLTDEQKACIEAANCPKIEMVKPQAGDFQPGQKGEKSRAANMSDEEKAAMQASRDCMKKAFEDCGIQMPERPNQPEGGQDMREVVARE